MRKIIDVLRLKFEAGLSHERVAAATKISKGAVTKYVHSAHKLHLEGESMRKRTAASTDKTPANKKKFDGA